MALGMEEDLDPSRFVCALYCTCVDFKDARQINANRCFSKAMNAPIKSQFLPSEDTDSGKPFYVTLNIKL
jgi:hypothetical protein